MTSRSAPRLITLCLALALASPVQAEPAGDPVAGQRLARSVCAACHEVERYWEFADLTAPPFTMVANSEHTRFSLRVFLRSPHATMPNLVLTATQIEDVAAYIWTMREE